SNDRDNHRVAKLLVCPGVRNRNPEAVVEPHQSRALPWRQTTRIPVAAAVDEDLGSVLVVPGGKCSCRVAPLNKAISESVALFPMLAGVVLEVVPELVREHVLREHLPFRPVNVGPAG